MSETGFLLGEHDESDELLRTYVTEALRSKLLPEIHHEVQDRLTSKHFMAHVGAQHQARLILEDVGGEARPDSQPAELVSVGRKRNAGNKYTQLLLCILLQSLKSKIVEFNHVSSSDVWFVFSTLLFYWLIFDMIPTFYCQITDVTTVLRFFWGENSAIKGLHFRLQHILLSLPLNIYQLHSVHLWAAFYQLKKSNNYKSYTQGPENTLTKQNKNKNRNLFLNSPDSKEEVNTCVVGHSADPLDYNSSGQSGACP